MHTCEFLLAAEQIGGGQMCGSEALTVSSLQAAADVIGVYADRIKSAVLYLIQEEAKCAV